LERKEKNWTCGEKDEDLLEVVEERACLEEESEEKVVEQN